MRLSTPSWTCGSDLARSRASAIPCMTSTRPISRKFIIHFTALALTTALALSPLQPYPHHRNFRPFQPFRPFRQGKTREVLAGWPLAWSLWVLSPPQRVEITPWDETDDWSIRTSDQLRFSYICTLDEGLLPLQENIMLSQHNKLIFRIVKLDNRLIEQLQSVLSYFQRLDLQCNVPFFCARTPHIRCIIDLSASTWIPACLIFLILLNRQAVLKNLRILYVRSAGKHEDYRQQRQTKPQFGASWRCNAFGCYQRAIDALRHSYVQANQSLLPFLHIPYPIPLPLRQKRSFLRSTNYTASLFRSEPSIALAHISSVVFPIPPGMTAIQVKRCLTICKLYINVMHTFTYIAKW